MPSPEIRLSCTKEQEEILQSDAKTKVLIKGRRWGGTTTGALHIAKTALEKPGTQIWYAAIAYPRAIEFRDMLAASPGFSRFINKSYKQYPPRIELFNGSIISFRSTDKAKNMRGSGLSLIVYDEAAFDTQDVFYEVLLPMLMDSRGTMFVISTYNGRNWCWDLAQAAKKDQTGGMRLWEYPTRTGIRFQSEEGKRALEEYKRRFSPAAWAQECECCPLQSANSCFRDVDRVVTEMPIMPQADGRYVLAHDIGRVKDPGSVVVMSSDGDVMETVVYPLGMDHDEQARKTKALSEKYGSCMVVVDVTGQGGSAIASEPYVDVYRKILPGLREITWTAAQKLNMVNLLALDIEQRNIRIGSHHKELIAQLKGYQYWMGEHALYPVYGARSGEHDDLVAALAMCCWARKANWIPRPGQFVSVRY